MDRVLSVEDLAGSFWSPAPAEGSSMNRSASEWYFDNFLEVAQEEAAVAPPLPIADRSPNPKPAAATMSSSARAVWGGGGGRKDEVRAADDEVVGIKAAVDRQIDSAAGIDPGEYAAILKQRLNMYCAAVAMSRMHPIMIRVYVLSVLSGCAELFFGR